MSYITQYYCGDVISQTIRLPKYNKLDVYNIVDDYMAHFHKQVNESIRNTGILVDSDFPIQEVIPSYDVKCDALEYTSRYKYNEFNVIVQPPTKTYLEIRLFLYTSVTTETTEEEYAAVLEKSAIQEIAFAGVSRELQEHCKHLCNAEAK